MRVLGSAVDDPGGGIDDPGGGDASDLGSFGNLATSTTTSSKTPVSFVSSSLTAGISLLPLSGKSAVGVVGGLDVGDCATGMATGPFCPSCVIPPRVVGGLWSDGVGCDACCYGCDSEGGWGLSCFFLFDFTSRTVDQKKKTPTANTVPAPFSHRRRSNQATCWLDSRPASHCCTPGKTKIAKPPQRQKPPAAPQHPPAAACGAGVGATPPRPPH
jgi:hypothetical protein